MFRFFGHKTQANEPASEDHPFQLRLFNHIEDNINNIKRMMHHPKDLIARTIKVGQTKHECAVMCIDGLIDKEFVQNNIIKRIQSAFHETSELSAKDIVNVLEFEVLAVNDIKKVHTLDDVSLAVMSGNTVVFVDGTEQVLVIGSAGGKSRSVSEPMTESVVRGPRDGFVEILATNLTLLRRRIHDPNLELDSYIIGRRSRKELVVAYINGIINPKIVNEVKRRLATIDTDDAPESGTIEQWIEDSFISPFPQMDHTERPDKVAAALMQGKVAIFLEGTPFVLIAPVTFGQMIQSPEDYYDRWLIATFTRLLRYGASFFAVFLPSIYIALVSFHPGMIPSKLAFSIAGTRDGVPFPAFVEALLMESTLELLREAGIRLPKPIGQTIGIVGGLVIGEAAVQAGIVSPIMVIVVSVTAISSFAIPSYSLGISYRLIRFGVMLFASIFGFYGIVLFYIILNIHITNLKSFGIPFSTPFAPFFPKDWKDLVLRAPITMLNKRPEMLQVEDKIRKGEDGQQ